MENVKARVRSIADYQFGKRGTSTLHLEGVSVNMPLIIEVIDSEDKLEPLLHDLKLIVGDNGLVTIQETYMV